MQEVDMFQKFCDFLQVEVDRLFRSSGAHPYTQMQPSRAEVDS
ncbi:hypothetical protein C791_5730 [Amycolatopsis azurea DSM 43854]|uniref:Uncharacterized protein n=1 Tax=Amycolatopsis azurea DSM 43854 TaxID=1238180 RepID=M2PYF7_9PSEU|nr:hypothetical protein C791_5730 [Amycolatopsis azurea DSM 43854]